MEKAIAAEIIKALLMTAFIEARRRGLSAEEIERISADTRAKVEQMDPADIPDV